MTVKKLVGYLHLWLGLASGLLVLVVALTGALYVFQDELETRLMHPRRYFVEVQHRPVAPVGVWLHTANAAFAQYDSVGHNRSVSWRPNTPGWAATVGTSYRAGGENHYLQAFLNPYTRQFLEVAETFGPTSFWRIILDLHVSFMLGDVGSEAVRYGTLLFLVILARASYCGGPRTRPLSGSATSSSGKTRLGGSARTTTYTTC